MIDTRPLLYGEIVKDGALALYRMRRNTAGGYNAEHVTTIFHPDCVQEALSVGWAASDGWREAMHRIVLSADVAASARAMFMAAVA